MPVCFYVINVMPTCELLSNSNEILVVEICVEKILVVEDF